MLPAHPPKLRIATTGKVPPFLTASLSGELFLAEEADLEGLDFIVSLAQALILVVKCFPPF
jgi:hypothetical protein